MLLVACRILQGCGGAMMVPVGRLTLVRTFARSELIRAMSFVAIPGLIGPMLGPIAGGLIVAYFHWRVIFFVNIPIGLAGLYLVYLHLPDYREKHTNPLDLVGLILFGSGIALLSYVLEVFGEHTLSARRNPGIIGDFLPAAQRAMACTRRGLRFPCCPWILFRIRTFRAAVSGSFFTRIGIGGIPFLFPLLYQVGLGFTPIQSGLLMMPQAIAAMSLKMTMPRILTRFGYRAVLISNTVDARPAHPAVRHDRSGHAGLAHRGAGVLLRLLQLAAIHQHEHAGLCRCQRGTDQQCQLHRQHHAADVDELRRRLRLARHRGLHSGSLSLQPAEMIHGIHKAFFVLGGLTVLSTIIFRELKAEDGDNVSQHGATTSAHIKAAQSGE